MSPTGRAGPTQRDPACYLKSLLKIVYVYMRRGPALLGEISLLSTRDNYSHSTRADVSDKLRDK